jgi:pentatricopeptide repeat protein
MVLFFTILTFQFLFLFSHKKSIMKKLIFLLALPLILLQCKNEKVDTAEKAAEPNLGKVEINVTGSEEAKPYFHEGLLLLHSFEFDDAGEKFAKAIELDPNFAMAAWGEAMSYNHPLWRERYTEDGIAALKKLGDSPEERLAKAPTEFEKDMLSAVEILYTEGEKKEQDVAYKDQMEKLYKKYEGNHEVAAFYALSLLGSVKGGRNTETYEKGARIAQSIIDENPNHPGALHYLIHSYDDPGHAKLALSAAHSYSTVAPDAEHALHMPSHIYVAMGMWDEVISSNIASYDASVARMKDKDLDNDARGYHAFKWLMYGYLQKGNFERAKEMVYDMKKYCDEKPSSKARSHFIMMQGAYLTESGNWEDSIALKTVDLEELGLPTKAVQHFTQGMLAYHQKDKTAVTNMIKEISKLRIDGEARMVVGQAKTCSGVSRYKQPPTKNGVNTAKVMEMELNAVLAMLNEDNATAEKWLKEATVLESETTFSYGPPNIVKPSHEFYGEWLLKNNKKEEAKKQFENQLERAPKRLLALKGLEKIE